MKLIPAKTSQCLLKIMGYYSTILYAVLLFAHALLRNSSPYARYSVWRRWRSSRRWSPGSGFWLEGRLFFLIYSSSLAACILYMLYVVIRNTTPGWGELTSLVGFMLIASAGMVLGLAAEFTRYLLKPKWRQRKQKPV